MSWAPAAIWLLHDHRPASGQLHVTARASAYHAVTKTAGVTGGQTTTVNCSLQPQPAPLGAR